MSATKTANTIVVRRPVNDDTLCYHCGAVCLTTTIAEKEKVFCCEGCMLIYEMLNNNGLCDYYKLQDHPGLTQVKAVRKDKYEYLDNNAIATKLYTFTDGTRSIIKFYIPGVHCSSCMWLLEHLHKLNEGVIESRLDFTSKEVTISFLNEKITLRQLVELLATIGYEPYISLDNIEGPRKSAPNRQKVYKLGVAGFCFGNIMLMSFPEYLSLNAGMEETYSRLFRVLNLILALPVFFYSASEFFSSAYAGIKQKMLNIDAPIVLALVITFSRSLYEILSNTGSGYLDSMTGIVFFMLVGRIVQERTYKSISFDRDYRSYFPVAVNVVTPDGVIACSLQDLKQNDIVELHNEEIIPADAVVLEGNALIDYSFVTGESVPVKIEKGNIVYAGGKQTGEKLQIRLVKPVAGSYLTSLWNHSSFAKKKPEVNDKHSVIHLLSKYFTYVLFVLAAITAAYWYMHDASKILPAVSAMLIVACPCALLLSANYTNGNILRLLSINGLYLRDTSVIEELGNIDHIVFDKTGTLTYGGGNYFINGPQLSVVEKSWVYNVAASSIHPYSKALADYVGAHSKVAMSDWKETAGKGVEAVIDGNVIKIGSAEHAGITHTESEKPAAYIRINNKVSSFGVNAVFRSATSNIIPRLSAGYKLSMLSGDNDRQASEITKLFGHSAILKFDQKPMDKLRFIESRQQKGEHVLMVGDGLNDAGALQQSNVGITLADDINNFSPACDAILDAGKIKHFPALINLSRSARHIITASFIISILYNIVGLFFSVQGKMNPMIAAILMPASTLSIVLVTTFSSSLIAKYFGLSMRN